MQLYRHRAYTEALTCFRKSRSWRPLQISCYLWTLRTWLALPRQTNGAAKGAAKSTNQRNVPAGHELLSHRDSKSAMARQ